MPSAMMGLRVVFVADEDEYADVVAAFVVFIGKIGRQFGVVCGIGFGVCSGIAGGEDTGCAV